MKDIYKPWLIAFLSILVWCSCDTKAEFFELLQLTANSAFPLLLSGASQLQETELL